MASTAGLLQFAHAQGFQFSHASGTEHSSKNQAKWGLLCGLLDAMDEVSKEERAVHEAKFELESREFENKFASTLSADSVSRRTQAANSLSDHLSELAAVERSELLRRIQAPFVEPHLALEESAHEDMVAVVEHAFSDICSVKHDMELATWTQSATVNIKDLEDVLASTTQGAAKIERLRAAVLDARLAMQELEEASSVRSKGTLA